MYDQPVSTTTVTAALQSSSNPAFKDQSTLNEIVALTTSTGGGATDTTVVITEVTVTGTDAPTIAAGTELALVTVTKTSDAPVVFSATDVKNVPVLVLQGDANVDVTLNDGATQGAATPTATSAGATVPEATAQRVVVAGSGNSKFTIADNKNTKLTLGSGNSTVVTGQGVDTVVAGMGNSTISAGTGNDYAVVKLNGAASNYTVSTTAVAGHAVVTDKVTGVTTDISKVQYVEVNGDDALIFAKDTTQASIATLYEVAFGKTVDAATLDQFFDSGKTVQQIANELVASPEFATRNLLDDRSFINSLYQNTFGRDGETAGINYWLGSIATHKATRADLIKSFAEIHTLNLAADGHGPGAQHEAVLIGNITVVSGII